MTTPLSPSARFSVINPATLGQMQVLETISTNDIISARIAKFVQLWAANDPPNAAQYDVGGLEFDPIKIQAELATFFELLVRDRVNQAARSVTLAYAISTDLDAIATRYPGGVPRLPGETDEHYRQRVWLSPNPLTSHGVGESYEFWGLTALDGIMHDTTATAVPGDPTVTITVMLDGTPVTAVTDASSALQVSASPNPTPTPDQVRSVFNYIMDDGRRGLTDVPVVRAPTVIQTPYNIRLWLYPGWDWTSVRASVVTALATTIESLRWLGASHTLMDIYAACAQPGVFDAAIDTPAADIIIDRHTCVVVTAVTLTLAGTGQ